ncbi:unnamed protein product, partial [marine sediment metagenome]
YSPQGYDFKAAEAKKHPFPLSRGRGITRKD